MKLKIAAARRGGKLSLEVGSFCRFLEPEDTWKRRLKIYIPPLDLFNHFQEGLYEFVPVRLNPS